MEPTKKPSGGRRPPYAEPVGANRSVRDRVHPGDGSDGDLFLILSDLGIPSSSEVGTYHPTDSFYRRQVTLCDCPDRVLFRDGVGLAGLLYTPKIWVGG